MMTKGWKQTLTAAAIGALMLGGGAGCFDSDNDGAPDRIRRDDADSLSGVPDRAKAVKEGKGELSFKATADGRVYLYDLVNDNLRHTANVREGDRYTASIDDDLVAINGERTTKVSLSSEHKHRLYFLPSTTNSDHYAKDSSKNGRSGSGVPDTAKQIAEERGREISYKASNDGTAYLYDATGEKLVETFRLESGQRLTVSPVDNAVAIDGKSVRGISLDRRTTYRLFFDKR